MRSFAPKKRAEPAPRLQFEVVFNRDEELETHQFQAIASADMATLSSILKAVNRNPEQAVPQMLRMIYKMLDNKDGVSSRWEPKPIRGDNGDDAMFRGPDDEPHPMADLEKFTAFEAGSSKRRWRHLMDEDDDIVVEAEVLQGVFEYLVGEASGRPTPPSS
jgi:hypothetical protein